MRRRLALLLTLSLCSPIGCAARPGGIAGGANDWKALEGRSLRARVQLTFPDRFERAGEAYFSPDGERIIFQAIEAPPAGKAPDEQYAMFVAPLKRDNGGAIAGLGAARAISPQGSANTCGFFHPAAPGRVIFGSTLTPPKAHDNPGYQRDTGRYAWAFPYEMEIVSTRLGPDSAPIGPLAPLWRRPGYDAEGAYSPDGRFIVHTRVEPATGDADIWVWDTRALAATPLIQAPGYDGGPFFSPDGRRICYRSDRRGDNLLQLFVADLRFDNATGAITGIERERPITNNQHVNWAPWWDPSGEFLVYTTSEIGHDNYEVFSIAVPPANAGDVDPASLPRRRITFAPGFDGLPAISPDGRLLMWTSQRGGSERQGGRSSQLWIARIVDLRPASAAHSRD